MGTIRGRFPFRRNCRSRHRLQIKRRTDHAERHMHQPVLIPLHNPPLHQNGHIIVHPLYIAVEFAGQSPDGAWADMLQAFN